MVYAFAAPDPIQWNPWHGAPRALGLGSAAQKTPPSPSQAPATPPLSGEARAAGQGPRLPPCHPEEVKPTKDPDGARSVLPCGKTLLAVRRQGSGSGRSSAKRGPSSPRVPVARKPHFARTLCDAAFPASVSASSVFSSPCPKAQRQAACTASVA